MASTTIYQFPEELLDNILAQAEPKSIAAFAQTCRSHRAVVYEAPHQHLWRSLYLAFIGLDDPRRCVDAHLKPINMINFSWKTELQRVVRAQTVMESPEVLREGEFTSILETLLTLCSRYPVQTGITNPENPSNLMWVAVMLCKDSFFDHPALPTPSAHEEPLLARLRTMYGLPMPDLKKERRVRSRGYVYDMRRYTSANRWGPLMADRSGRVDWKLMCEIHHVMSMHIVGAQDLDQESTIEFFVYPMSLPFCQPLILPEEQTDERDWAGVTGTFRICFAFCDHRELLFFNNFNSLDDEPNMAIFEDPDFEEAFHSLDAKLWVSSTRPDPAWPEFPRISFEGQLNHASHPTISGTVKMTPDGFASWHFTSGDIGQAIWSSEGVQIGGLRSSFGVLGIWTTVFHEETDPVGPFWLTRLRKHDEF